MVKYFVDIDGNYLGGFDGADPPSESVEVPFSPIDARDIWDGIKFTTPLSVVADNKNESALERLKEIDLESLRSIREFMLSEFGSNPNLDPKLQQLEDEAITKRSDVR